MARKGKKETAKKAKEAAIMRKGRIHPLDMLVVVVVLAILALLPVGIHFVRSIKSARAEKAETERMGRILYPEYNPSEGKAIVENIREKYKPCSLDVLLSGDLSDKICLVVEIPSSECEILSLEDKKKILNYLSSLVPDAMANPDRYSLLSPDAPVFRLKIMDRYTKIMTYRSCAISAGPIVEGFYYEPGTAARVYGSFIDEQYRIAPYDLDREAVLGLANDGKP